MKNMSNKLSLSKLGKSLSLQSCFPEVKSANDSGCKSPENSDISLSIRSSDGESCNEDTSCLDNSDNEILPALLTVKSPVGSSHTLRPGTSRHSRGNGLETEKCEGEVFINPPTRQFTPGFPSTCPSVNFDEKLRTQTADSASFPLATVPLSGTISGELRGNGLATYVVLYLAALKDDWDTALEFLYKYPQAVRARITRRSETALHIAAGAKSSRFVEELVKLMSPDDLALQNKVGNTALCFAAATGIKKIAEVMVNKNPTLPWIRGSKGALPLYIAALLGHRDMVWYLYSVTDEDDMGLEDCIALLIAAITANLFDVALHMIKQHPELALARDANGDTALHVLARKPSAFSSGCQLGVWQRCIYSFPGLNVIHDKNATHIQALELVELLWNRVLLEEDSKIGELIRSPSRLLFTAAELGIVELITVLIRSYPDLIWKVDDKSRSIFHIAVAHRQEKIFNLIYEIGAHKDLIAAYKDDDNNNMLHLAGKLAPSNRLKTDSGAALQLRRELRWFKEVEKIVQPLYTEMKDSKGRTPRILFTEEHIGLAREGEKWMKDTASSCMVVATLIATVMFAAAFTIPGGNDEDGKPIFVSKKSFVIFTISDALALFSSATSILMFLSIITSRYAEEDFLESLPNRLVIGLATLFLSIATMMISFCATLFIVLDEGLGWVGLPMALLACVPVTLFALLQFPLFHDMVNHTYRPGILFRPSKNLLY